MTSVNHSQSLTDSTHDSFTHQVADFYRQITPKTIDFYDTTERLSFERQFFFSNVLALPLHCGFFPLVVQYFAEIIHNSYFRYSFIVIWLSVLSANVCCLTCQFDAFRRYVDRFYHQFYAIYCSQTIDNKFVDRKRYRTIMISDKSL